MMLDLRKDEEKLIKLIRQSPKFATITVEKRPNTFFPMGEITRVSIEESYLLPEVLIENIDLKEK